jgi:hypothetical protein
MNDKLRKDVQNFLLDYEERIFMLALNSGNKIEHNLADDLKTTNSLLETAVYLLQRVMDFDESVK